MGYLTIIRPVNCVITFISVLVGAWVSKELVFSLPIILAGITGFLVCAFGNVINDIYDIEIDRINNPKRPLASGQLKKQTATAIAIILTIIALFFSFILGFLPFLFVVAVLFLLFLYAHILKKNLLGNLLVALIAGLSFIFGGLINNNFYSLIPFIFAIFIHPSREIIKDVIDIEGDRLGGVRSLPILLGEKRALYISSLALVLLCFMLPLPFIFKILNINYLLIVIIGTYPLIIYVIWQLLFAPAKAGDYIKQQNHQKNLVRLSNLLKVSMGVGLLGFLLG